jgi:serine/threonine protein kinase
MVCGDIPFETDSQIKKANLYFRDALGLSEDLKDLIRACLNVSSSDRMSLAQLAEHPWLATNSEADSQKERPVLQRTISAPVNVVGNNNNGSNIATAAATTATTALTSGESSNDNSSHDDDVMKASNSTCSMETVEISGAESLDDSSFASPTPDSFLSDLPSNVPSMFNSGQFLTLSPALTSNRQLIPKVSGSDEDDESFYSDHSAMSVSPIPFSCRNSFHPVKSDEHLMVVEDDRLSHHQPQQQQDSSVEILQDRRFLISHSLFRPQLSPQPQLVLPPFHQLKSKPIAARM